jgi:hypothetical protein
MTEAKARLIEPISCVIAFLVHEYFPEFSHDRHFLG